LARVSFAGTAMISPIILVGVLSKKTPGLEIIIVSATALVLFLLSLVNIVPPEVYNVRIDLALMITLALISGVSFFVRKTHKVEVV